MVDPSADHRREPDIPPNPSVPVAGRPPGVSGSSGFPAVDVATTGERSEVQQSTVDTELEAGTTTAGSVKVASQRSAELVLGAS